MAPAEPSAPPKTDSPKAEPVPLPKKEVSADRPAKLVVVDLPDDARLYIDDQLMKASSPRRVFRTPQLERDQTYYYILRAEVSRDGQTVSKTKRVIVRPGEEVQASFAELHSPATVEATAKAGR